MHTQQSLVEKQDFEDCVVCSYADKVNQYLTYYFTFANNYSPLKQL